MEGTEGGGAERGISGGRGPSVHSSALKGCNRSLAHDNARHNRTSANIGKNHTNRGIASGNDVGPILACLKTVNV